MISNPNFRNDPQRPILEHIRALRDMVVFGGAAWLVCSVLAGVFSPWILARLKAPALEYEGMLQGLDLTSGFSAILSISLWGGVALGFPFMAYAILRFVFPALTRKEKTVLLSVLLSGSALFLTGVYLAYAQTLPLVVSVFQRVNAWVGLPVTTIRIEGYIAIAIKTIIAFGLVFQLPLVLFVLGLFGVVTSRALREKRRVAIVASFVLGMLLTPPDPMSQILMAVPLCLLYEISIWAVYLKERAR